MNTKKPYYPILEAKIAENGISKKAIAKELGISPRSLSLKLSGSIDFWWKEVVAISQIFPESEPFSLFKHGERRV